MSLLRVLLGAIVLSLLLARPVSGVSANPADTGSPQVAVASEGGRL